MSDKIKQETGGRQAAAGQLEETQPGFVAVDKLQTMNKRQKIMRPRF